MALFIVKVNKTLIFPIVMYLCFNRKVRKENAQSSQLSHCVHSENIAFFAVHQKNDMDSTPPE
jgi:hypothetical protein